MVWSRVKRNEMVSDHLWIRTLNQLGNHTTLALSCLPGKSDVSTCHEKLSNHALDVSQFSFPSNKTLQAIIYKTTLISNKCLDCSINLAMVFTGRRRSF